MKSQNNYIMQADTNVFNNYYNNTDNNYELNQEKNITNNAKELVKNFRNQYLTNNNNNQRIYTTEINQDSQNYISNPILYESNKTQENINTNNYYLNQGIGGIGGMGPNNSMTPVKNNFINDVDSVGQENAKLKKTNNGFSIRK